MQRPHESDSVGRLRNYPRDRREPDEKQRAQTYRGKEDAADRSQACIDSAETGENVKTRQTDQDRQESSERDFCRRDPHLLAAGKTSDDNAVRGHAQQREDEEPERQRRSPIILQLMNDPARIFQQSLDDEDRRSAI